MLKLSQGLGANLCYSPAKENGKAGSYHRQIFQKMKDLEQVLPLLPRFGCCEDEAAAVCVSRRAANQRQ